MRSLLLVLFLVLTLFAAQKTDVTTAVVAETTKVAICDSVMVIKYDTVKVTKTLADTTKVIKVDSVRTVKLDTIKPTKKTIKK